MAQLLIEIDLELRRRFKRAALADNTTMAVLMRNYIIKYLAEKETKTVVY